MRALPSRTCVTAGGLLLAVGVLAATFLPDIIYSLNRGLDGSMQSGADLAITVTQLVVTAAIPVGAALLAAGLVIAHLEGGVRDPRADADLDDHVMDVER